MSRCPRCGKETAPMSYCGECGHKLGAEDISRGVRAPSESWRDFDKFVAFAKEHGIKTGEAFALLADFGGEDILQLANHATHGDVKSALSLMRGLVKNVCNGGKFGKRVIEIYTKEEMDAQYAVKKALKEERGGK